jgi:hypothetical protein
MSEEKEALNTADKVFILIIFLGIMGIAAGIVYIADTYQN